MTFIFFIRFSIKIMSNKVKVNVSNIMSNKVVSKRLNVAGY